MKREIKFEYGFKSVNGIVKKQYYLHEIPYIQQKCDVFNDLPIVYARQFTGLKDKKEKEIYEGDIVKYRGFEVANGKQIRPEKIIIIKNYLNDSIRVKNIMDSGMAAIEIIGNIYENKELLK